MTTLASGLSAIDLRFLGRPHAIAAALVQGSGGVALIDPGPTTCLATLEAEMARRGTRLADLTHILLTHIHLDHAAATGTIVRAHPHVRVLVHEVGAPHMTDPARLIASATRLYGDDMERLWGEFAPVPAANVDVLTGGERLEIAGRSFEVAYTPGHASHHVSYFDRSSGVAFVGDTAGMSIDGGYVLPPTPPPDIDLDLWRGSIAAIDAWSPDTLFLTHFGPVVRVATHLQTLLDNLSTTAALVRETLREEGSDDERMERFSARLRREMRRDMGDVQLESYGVSAPLSLQWLGLARYWRRSGGAPPGAR